jgi:hypothetical protein
MVFGARNSRADVRENGVAHAIGGKVPVGGGEFDAQLPFFRAGNFLWIGRVRGRSLLRRG